MNEQERTHKKIGEFLEEMNTQVETAMYDSDYNAGVLVIVHNHVDNNFIVGRHGNLASLTDYENAETLATAKGIIELFEMVGKK